MFDDAKLRKIIRLAKLFPSRRGKRRHRIRHDRTFYIKTEHAAMPNSRHIDQHFVDFLLIPLEFRPVRMFP